MMQLQAHATAIADDMIRGGARLGETGDDTTSLFVRQDHLDHLAFLTEALRSGEPALFIDYVGWAKSRSAARGVSPLQFADTLRALRGAIGRHVAKPEAEAAGQQIEAALAQLPWMQVEPTSFLAPSLPVSDSVALARDFMERMLRADRRGAAGLVMSAVAGGMPLKRVYLDVFQQTQREVGRLWQLGRISVAQEHYCTAATFAIMNQLFGQVMETPRIGRKLLAFGIEGDLHEIGLRIVADLFELAGWDCDYIGVNTPAEAILDSLPAARPDLIAISATMTYHVEAIEDFIRALRAHTAGKHIPVLVGGGPFAVARNLWRRVGADGWAVDAEQAVIEGGNLVDGLR